MNAADIMTQPVISVGPEATIVEAAQLMMQHRISGLPVIDESGDMVGLIDNQTLPFQGTSTRST